MTSKSTSSYKHHEYKQFSSADNNGSAFASNGSAFPVSPVSNGSAFSEGHFDKLRSELTSRNVNGSARPVVPNGGETEYHYEYREEKHPSGNYDRKDLHSVEQYVVPAKRTAEQNKTYYAYSKEEKLIPASQAFSQTKSINTSMNTSGREHVSHNVDQLDSLLVDLQKDQQRQHHSRASNYTDTMESSSFDYRKSTHTPTPVRPVTSGHSTMKSAEMIESWRSETVPPTPVRHIPNAHSTMKSAEMLESWRSETVPPTPVRHVPNAHSTMKSAEMIESWRSETVPPTPPPVQKEITREHWREETSESRVIPSQVSPAIPKAVPPVLCSRCQPPGSPPMNKVTTTVKTYTYEIPADQDPTSVPIPGYSTTETSKYLTANTATSKHILPPPSPSLGCQYCSHCNSRITNKEFIHSRERIDAVPSPVPTITNDTLTKQHYTSTTSNQILKPVNEPIQPSIPIPLNGHPPGTYKWTETSYSAFDEVVTSGRGEPSPLPPTPSPAPIQQTPKRLDELMNEFPTEHDGHIVKRDVEVLKDKPPVSPPPATKNVSGPAVYYPPNHEIKGKSSYEIKEGGGKRAKGSYEYEASAKSKEKHSESKKVTPICVPLCCAMPCSIM